MNTMTLKTTLGALCSGTTTDMKTHPSRKHVSFSDRVDILRPSGVRQSCDQAPGGKKVMTRLPSRAPLAFPYRKSHLSVIMTSS